MRRNRSLAVEMCAGLKAASLPKLTQNPQAFRTPATSLAGDAALPKGA